MAWAFDVVGGRVSGDVCRLPAARPGDLVFASVAICRRTDQELCQPFGTLVTIR